MRLTFIETTVFTARIGKLGLEAGLHALQDTLLQAPQAGRLDPGTGGLRKIRIPDPMRGKGKRSGARVHYLWLPHRQRIYLMYVYSKDETATLSTAQKRSLYQVVQAIKAAVEERTP